MPTFAYTARDRTGKLVEGRSRAAAETELRRELQSAGLMLVKAKPDTGQKRRVGGRVKPKDLILFTFNMHNVMDSGVPLLTGLQDMIDETRQPRLKRVLEEILESVTAGDTFSQALARHPDVFDPLYVHMCEAGEQSGRLPHAMERLMSFLEWREDFRHGIKDLMTYPIVVVIALVGLVGLVVGVVFPRFAEVFARVNFELPWSTRFLLSLSDFMTTYWWACLIGMALLWALAVFLKSIPPVKMVLHTVILKVPVVGDLVSMLNFGQVANSMASFVDSGIPIPTALELIEKIVPNVRVATSIRQAREGILGGKTLATAFRDAAIFPPLVLRMVNMGEQSGRIVESLEKAAKIYDREIPQKTKRVLDLMNPILTIVIGGLLLFVILSVMSPLYRMYQEIGQSY